MPLAWLQLVATIVAAGVIVTAAATALGSRPTFAWLRSLAPATRFRLLVLLAVAPVVGGVLALSIAFAPSVLDALGLVADHCGHHPGHDFHLCFVHGTPPAVSTGAIVVGALALGWLGRTWVPELLRIVRSRSWARRLDRLSRWDDDLEGWTFDSELPLAFSVGFVRPRIFVAEGVPTLLPDEQMSAVLAHERAHVRRRDALVKSIVRLFCALHLPWFARRLLDELELASEQACDEYAVSEVGDPLAVAEAILAMHRAGGRQPLPAIVARFGAAAVEERVRAVLDAQWRAPAWSGMATVAAVGLVALARWYDELHHDAETLLAHLF